MLKTLQSWLPFAEAPESPAPLTSPTLTSSASTTSTIQQFLNQIPRKLSPQNRAALEYALREQAELWPKTREIKTRSPYSRDIDEQLRAILPHSYTRPDRQNWYDQLMEFPEYNLREILRPHLYTSWLIEQPNKIEQLEKSAEAYELGFNLAALHVPWEAVEDWIERGGETRPGQLTALEELYNVPPGFPVGEYLAQVVQEEAAREQYAEEAKRRENQFRLERRREEEEKLRRERVKTRPSTLSALQPPRIPQVSTSRGSPEVLTSHGGSPQILTSRGSPQVSSFGVGSPRVGFPPGFSFPESPPSLPEGISGPTPSSLEFPFMSARVARRLEMRKQARVGSPQSAQKRRERRLDIVTSPQTARRLRAARPQRPLFPESKAQAVAPTLGKAEAEAIQFITQQILEHHKGVLQHLPSTRDVDNIVNLIRNQLHANDLIWYPDLSQAPSGTAETKNVGYSGPLPRNSEPLLANAMKENYSKLNIRETPLSPRDPIKVFRHWLFYVLHQNCDSFVRGLLDRVDISQLVNAEGVRGSFSFGSLPHRQVGLIGRTLQEKPKLFQNQPWHQGFPADWDFELSVAQKLCEKAQAEQQHERWVEEKAEEATRVSPTDIWSPTTFGIPQSQRSTLGGSLVTPEQPSEEGFSVVGLPGFESPAPSTPLAPLFTPVGLTGGFTTGLSRPPPTAPPYTPFKPEIPASPIPSSPFIPVSPISSIPSPLTPPAETPPPPARAVKLPFTASEFNPLGANLFQFSPPSPTAPPSPSPPPSPIPAQTPPMQTPSTPQEVAPACCAMLYFRRR